VNARAEAEFEAYVAGRMPALLRFAHLLIGDEPRARELVDAALALEYRRRRFDPAEADERARGWIVRAYLRGGEQPSPVDTDPDADPMWVALAQLSPRQRAVLVLRYGEAYGNEEIASATGLSPSAVSQLADATLSGLAGTPPAVHSSPSGRPGSEASADPAGQSRWARPRSGR
jgi:hypothetical protein